ncbi:hypothetical protein ACFQ1E_20045, partial [Sphingomonas canadensis]
MLTRKLLRNLYLLWGFISLSACVGATVDNEGLRAIPVNLAQLERQGKEFDRRWVEFEAYVFVRGYLGKN